MTMYELPTRLIVCGSEYEIRSDYRVALDICAALSDAELDYQDKVLAALKIFYPTFSKMPPKHYQEATKQCFWFINCGHDEDQTQKTPKLVNWEHDFQHIVAPVNRVLGQEIRAVTYLHWWSFIAAYYEIGDCTFAQVVRIRDKKARGKSLDKADQEWYNRNRNMVDIPTNYTETEKDVLALWGG